MISVKSIKPSRLKDDLMRLELLSGMHEVGRDAVKEYKKTVETWTNKPDFEYLISLKPEPTIVVGPTGNDEAVQHYEWVDKGTKRHWVGPVNKLSLYFQGGYSAKTTPNVIGSKAGGPYGSFVHSKGHYVNGIEPRNFDKLIEKEMSPKFKRRMEEAMRNAAEKSGFQI